MTEDEVKKEMLRHTVATLAYRGTKAVRGGSEEFANFDSGNSSRTPLAILAHIGDLLDWALALAKGEEIWRNSQGESWAKETERFYSCLQDFDEFLGSDAELKAPAERLFQGPIADALTHVGQISLLRRLAKTPVRGENYYIADIEVGTTGPKQAAPKVEFG